MSGTRENAACANCAPEETKVTVNGELVEDSVIFADERYGVVVRLSERRKGGQCFAAYWNPTTSGQDVEVIRGEVRILRP